MAKQKYYAVARGRQVGVFTDWPTTEKLVRGYTGARYKSFLDKASAEAFVKDPSNTTPRAHHQSKTKTNTNTPVDLKAAKAIFYTDGGSRNTGNVAGGHVKSNDKAAWAYLIKYRGQELADSAGEFGATNNRMEITALRNALQRLLDLGLAQELLVGVLDSKYVLDSINLGCSPVGSAGALKKPMAQPRKMWRYGKTWQLFCPSLKTSNSSGPRAMRITAATFMWTSC
ncbi:ribonuclease HI [Agrilactobacillus composti DSM 18527 = JCM 14202]|uniref:ribonuclease H family protein n=1 Tax=Agrilactobacillus composti TaxID=398555 RepID=UPI00042DE133|nr:ribonuclease H family protein [Agrilactobacillus composti]GAF39200.1 ribonuclease HI [Agrilactobacillus composti DSM 18527 = JCM 14202]